MKTTPLIDEIRYCYDNNLIINYNKKGSEYYFMSYDSQELCLVDFISFYLDWLESLEKKYEEKTYQFCPFSIEDQKDTLEDLVFSENIKNKQGLLERHNILCKPNKYRNEENWKYVCSFPIVEILDFYKIKHLKDRCGCPIHGGKNDTSFGFKNNLYNCFSCGAKGSALQLVISINNCTKIQAFDIILGMKN